MNLPRVLAVNGYTLCDHLIVPFVLWLFPGYMSAYNGDRFVNWDWQSIYYYTNQYTYITRLAFGPGVFSEN